MAAHNRHTKLPLIALAALLTLGRARAEERADPRLEKVFADWQKRQQRVQTVRYRISGEQIVAKESIFDPLHPKVPAIPKKDVKLRIQRMMLLDFPKNRHRLELDEEEYNNQGDKLNRHVHAGFFDGQVLKGKLLPGTSPRLNGEPNEPRADLGVVKGYMGGAAFNCTYDPLFYGHGSIVYDDARIMPGKLLLLPQKEVFAVHGQAVHNGRNCLLLRTRPRQLSVIVWDEFWVDTERDSAIVRSRRVYESGVERDLDVGYRQTSAGWLADRWTSTQFDMWDGRLATTVRLHVDELVLEPVIARDEFEFKAAPGALVVHDTIPEPEPSQPYQSGKHYYRVGKDGSLTEVFFK